MILQRFSTLYALKNIPYLAGLAALLLYHRWVLCSFPNVALGIVSFALTPRNITGIVARLQSCRLPTRRTILASRDPNVKGL
jgi:hypothetical protein